MQNSQKNIFAGISFLSCRLETWSCQTQSLEMFSKIRCSSKFHKFLKSLFLLKLPLWGPAALLKKPPTQVLSWDHFPANNYFEQLFWTTIFLRTTILKNICERLLLNLFKNRLQHRCFPVNFVNYSKSSILKSTYERLVLKHWYGGFSLIKLQAWQQRGL